MKTRKGPKTQRSADGVNVREGETYYEISGGGRSGYQIKSRTLMQRGEFTEWNLNTGTTERINNTGVYFNCNRENAFYERENAVAEIIRRLKEKVRRLESEIAKWESPATADPDERAKAK